MEKNYDFFCILGLILFPLIIIFIAPVWHEFSHIIVLKYYNCDYNLNIFFSSSGFYGEIEPCCDLNPHQHLFLLFSGSVGNILLGFLFSSLGWHYSKKKKPSSIFFSIIGISFLFSPMIYSFTSYGDWVNSLKIINYMLNIQIPNFILPIMGTSLFLIPNIRFFMNFKYILNDWIGSEIEIIENEVMV